MEGTHVTDLWGIASRTGKKLAAMNIHTAKDLRDAEAKWIRKRFSVVMERTVHELRGIPCLPVEDEPPAHQDQLIFSRSFSQPVTTPEQMRQVLSIYAQRASTRLRDRGLVVPMVSAWAATSRFKEGEHHSPYVSVALPVEGDDPVSISRAAQALVPRIRSGFSYVRAGVVLTGLRPNGSAAPLDLFAADFEGRRIGETLDAITRKHGPRAVGLGFGGLRNAPSWTMKRAMLSPRATTHWDELCEAFV